ncbi:MAG: NusG domain II-containing protein [Candidatus Cloacimonetes bacterium]|nr:NusG domain II-containing protein [Candidatus Cloacimonadota bacterium]
MIQSIRKNFTVMDLFLVSTIILVSCLISIRIYSKNTTGKAIVYKDDMVIAELPLNKDRIFVIDDHNTLEIKNGRIRMIKSDCPDKRCIKQGFIRSMPIICMPNKVVIEIVTDRKEKPRYILH